MEEFQSGDIIVSPKHQGIYYLVIKNFGTNKYIPKECVPPELALVMVSNTTTEQYPLPGLCQTLGSIGTTDWVTQEGLKKSGFIKTGVNIAGVLNKIGETIELA